MKRNLFITLMLVCIFAFAGCGDKKVEESNDKTNTETSSDFSYASLLPKTEDYFPNAEVTVSDADGGTTYIFHLKNFTQEEIDSYWEECKNLGFSNVSYESNGMYGAYTEDKEYWVELSFFEDGKGLTVVCKKSRKK